MTLGKREYSEADMLRMQREAEERVRDMQNRARATVEQDSMNIPPRNRNWTSGPGARRQNRRSQPHTAESQQRQQERRQPPPPPPEETPKEPPEETSAPPQAAEEKKQTTIIEDVMGALSLDEDYLLIIGLMLILINQRADTTLILALAYLLI